MLCLDDYYSSVYLSSNIGISSHLMEIPIDADVLCTQSNSILHINLLITLIMVTDLVAFGRRYLKNPAKLIVETEMF